ncbi:MAG: hypothetical protein FJ390_07235, partial [Verrucomicrobia bacterium]|nr:hypothetical protein [Verrucomicrobiota bacterium]
MFKNERMTELHVQLLSMEKSFIFIVVAILAISSLKAEAQPTTDNLLSAVNNSSAPTLLTGNIQLSGRQLLVDGVPFVMKGICYSPIKKGMMYPDGLITLNPTSDDLVTIEKDFQMMQQAGINTIRTYLPITNAAILALLNKYHLRTIVPICPSWDCYQDLDTITKNVELLKNEPSTLMWEIGNEWNINHFYTYNPGTANQDQGSNNLSEQQCLDLIQTVASLVKEHDGVHPVSCDIGCPPVRCNAQNNGNSSGYNDADYQLLPNCVDMVGVNVYYGLN